MELANKNGMMFYETSAKSGFNVEEIFNSSAKAIAQKIDDGYYDLSNDSCGIKQGINASVGNNVSLSGEGKIPSKGGCCN